MSLSPERHTSTPPTVLKVLEDIWSDLRTPESNQISPQDLLMFGVAAFEYAGEVSTLISMMDKDLDGKIGKLDFMSSTCETIDKLWEEQSVNKAPKPWTDQQKDKEKFQIKAFRKLQKTSQKIRANRANLSSPAAVSPPPRPKKTVSAPNKRKLLQVIALTDEAFLKVWQIGVCWTALKDRVDDEQIELIWTNFLQHHEDNPLSGFAKQLPEHVLTSTADDPVRGRKLAQLELARMRESQMMPAHSSTHVTVRSISNPVPKSDCRACAACVLC